MIRPSLPVLTAYASRVSSTRSASLALSALALAVFSSRLSIALEHASSMSSVRSAAWWWKAPYIDATAS
jgi:hypothetical protein